MMVLLADCRSAVENLANGVARTLDGIRRSGDLIVEIDRSCRSVAKMVDGLALTAVQTNMLAVSGSVEAARAGSSGRGFAIVSGDIRKLARESARSADEAKEVVEAMREQVADLRRDLGDIAAGSQLEVTRNRQVMLRLDEITTRIEQLRLGNARTAEGAATILIAVQEVIKGTHLVAAVAEQAASASRQASSAASEQARGAEDLASAIEEIALLATELQRGEG
jgi:methyl-accepting chemotaxis protein